MSLGPRSQGLEETFKRNCRHSIFMDKFLKPDQRTLKNLGIVDIYNNSDIELGERAGEE